jgi:hypothetical protein
MRTREEVKHAFTPVTKLDQVKLSTMLQLQMRFLDLADDIMLNVPECPDRTAALRKLLECKFTCIQAVTHSKPVPITAPVQAPAPSPVAKGKVRK